MELVAAVTHDRDDLLSSRRSGGYRRPLVRDERLLGLLAAVATNRRPDESDDVGADMTPPHASTYEGYHRADKGATVDRRHIRSLGLRSFRLSTLGQHRGATGQRCTRASRGPRPYQAC